MDRNYKILNNYILSARKECQKTWFEVSLKVCKVIVDNKIKKVFTSYDNKKDSIIIHICKCNNADLDLSTPAQTHDALNEIVLLKLPGTEEILKVNIAMIEVIKKMKK